MTETETDAEIEREGEREGERERETERVGESERQRHTSVTHGGVVAGTGGSEAGILPPLP